MDAHLAPRIEEVLKSLTGTASLALIREARSELSATEQARLTSEQKRKWAKLRAPARRLEWSEARRCEWEIRSRLGERAKTNLSHTRQGEIPIVFAIGSSGDHTIGIDVELRSRAVSSAVARKFTLPGEESLGLDPLQLWVVKEAVFKANPENTGTVVQQYEVTSFDSGMRRGVASFGGREMRFACVDAPGWVVCVAVGG